MNLVSLAAACGQYGASSRLWEADNSGFCQVGLSSSLGPFGALRQLWEVPSEAAATSPAGLGGGFGRGMPRCICTALETTAHRSCLAPAVFGSGFLQEALEGAWAFISSKAGGPPALVAPGPQELRQLVFLYLRHCETAYVQASSGVCRPLQHLSNHCPVKGSTVALPTAEPVAARTALLSCCAV